MKLKNFTPHDIKVMSEASEIIAIFPSEGIARVSTASEAVGQIASMPLYSVVYGSVQGLPEPEDDVVYIVSSMVKTALRHRLDVVSPTELVRDAEGNTIGCKGFSL